jgi:alpha-D-xyloside xylohydrolase
MDHDMEWGEGFPAPRAMADRLHAKGFRLCLWVNTWFLTDSPKARQAREFGYLLHKADGSEHTWDMGSRCMVVQVDLTHAPAREWFKDQLKGLLDDGADTFFCDWGVDSPVDLNYKTTDGLSYSNAHSLEFLSAAHEAIKEHTGAPGITWSLCGYGGVQRYPASYAGDSRCTFRDLANVLRGGLSGSMSGVGLWGAEIGGFGRSDTGGPDAELYVRYLQHGFLLPFAEFHGIGPREPWHYGEEVAALYRRYAQLRYRLLPYLYAQMHHACDTGIPVLRPMMLEFPDDFNTRHLDLQYMLGDALLVAPIVDRSTRRPVYLPPGTWFDFWTDRAITGGAWIDYDAPLDRLPLFVRGGHALLVGPGGQNAAEAFAAPPEIHLYGDAEATALASDGSTCQRVTITNTDGCLSLPGPDRTYVLHGVGPIKHLRAGEASCKVPAAAPVFADVGVKANAVTILVSGDAAALVEFE